MSSGHGIPLAVLGGGIAGLAAGLFARQANRPFTVFEAGPEPGGMCRTLRFGDFLVDTGAHRFHAKISDSTALVRELLGDELAEVSVPSEIFENGRSLRFPLEPINLLKARGPAFVLAASLDMLWSRLRLGTDPDADFERFALARYGGKVARPYLLDYSEKLWGCPTSELSPAAAGSRLQGIKPTTMFSTLSKGNAADSPHMEGTFLYPRRGGFAAIASAMSAACGPENIRCGARVTRIIHDGRSVRAVEIGGCEIVDVGAAITTLPLTEILAMMDPPPPEEVIQAASGLRFRSLALAILLLDQPDITQSATIYFPEAKYPFTRVYEPNRRSKAMSPPGRTSLVAEFPCNCGDEVWEEDGALVGRAAAALSSLGWIREDRIFSTATHRLSHAYPVLTLEAAGRREVVFRWLETIDNLFSAGRAACFRYTHVHDHIQEACQAVATLANRERRRK